MTRRIVFLSLTLSLLTCCASCQHPPDEYGKVGDFTLTERSGRTVSNADLRGKVWIASFVFTRCTGPCPQVSLAMKRLQADLRSDADVRLVTFTVDPERDRPDDLSRYAQHFDADADRWLFLTGDEKAIYRLLYDGFHVPVEKAKGEEHEIMHSPKLVLVDRQGRIRGYFDGVQQPYGDHPDRDLDRSLHRLAATAQQLEYEDAGGFGALRRVDFPVVNASLNALAGALILLGFTAVRGRLYRLHACLMLTALAVSALFLASYLYYHIAIRGGKPTHFADQAPDAPLWVGRAYLGILISHTILAVAAAPMALYTAYQGLRGRLKQHIRIARWTLPIWLYVSITGVVVYWMLYQMYRPG